MKKAKTRKRTASANGGKSAGVPRNSTKDFVLAHADFFVEPGAHEITRLAKLAAEEGISTPKSIENCFYRLRKKIAEVELKNERPVNKKGPKSETKARIDSVSVLEQFLGSLATLSTSLNDLIDEVKVLRIEKKSLIEANERMVREIHQIITAVQPN